MAKAVVEAEFPDLMVVTVFSVFALADEEKAVAELAVNQTHCQRLAKLFSVDAQALACQIARQRPTAQAINNSTQCSNHEAWQKSVQRSKQVRASAEVGLMLDALQPVVMSTVLRRCCSIAVAVVKPSGTISLAARHSQAGAVTDECERSARRTRRTRLLPSAS
jgi:hypothetical protein